MVGAVAYRRRSRVAWVLLATGVWVACGTPAGSESFDPAPVADAGTGPREVPADPGTSITSESEALRRCAELGRQMGFGYPDSIAAAIAHINALPQPSTVACFVASLPRPLSAVATRSVFSAQPAVGERSPRLFIMGEPLILSVVPDGLGSYLLEFGEQVGEGRSIKGEVEFPVYDSLTADAPFTRVFFTDTVTSCGLCHREEWPSTAYPNAFESLAFRPQPETEVPLADVLGEHMACNAAAEPARCEILDALFGFGTVSQGAFPPDMATFF